MDDDIASLVATDVVAALRAANAGRDQGALPVESERIQRRLLPINRLAEFESGHVEVTVSPGLKGSSTQSRNLRQHTLTVAVAVEAKCLATDSGRQDLLMQFGQWIEDRLRRFYSPTTDATESVCQVRYRFDPAALRSKSLWVSVREFEFHAERR